MLGMRKWWRRVPISVWPLFKMNPEGRQDVLDWLKQQEFPSLDIPDKGEKLMTEEVAKVTVIVETRTARRTFIYPKGYNVRFNESMSDVQYRPHHNDRYMVPRQPEHMNVEFTLVAVKDENEHFRTMQLEDLDPIPDEIRELVTKATQHNLNDVKREKLIKALTNLVETDRKEKSK